MIDDPRYGEEPSWFFFPYASRIAFPKECLRRTSSKNSSGMSYQHPARAPLIWTIGERRRILSQLNPVTNHQHGNDNLNPRMKRRGVELKKFWCLWSVMIAECATHSLPHTTPSHRPPKNADSVVAHALPGGNRPLANHRWTTVPHASSKKTNAISKTYKKLRCCRSSCGVALA